MNLGDRVELSLAGIKARIIIRGPTAGVVVGLAANGGGLRVQVLRDCRRRARWYDASFWQVVQNRTDAARRLR